MKFEREMPPGLGSRATAFMTHAAVWQPAMDISPYVEDWLLLGTPVHVVEQMHAYQARWGGLILPPHFFYDGGIAQYNAEEPCELDCGYGFLAGSPRRGVPYHFVIGPEGQFGLATGEFIPLHRSIEGWIEALALSYLADSVAAQTERTLASEVSVEAMVEIPEVVGLGDTWWHSSDRMVAIQTGQSKVATTYWGATLEAVDQAAAGAVTRIPWPGWPGRVRLR